MTICVFTGDYVHNYFLVRGSDFLELLTTSKWDQNSKVHQVFKK